jgi:hypothetical protein
MDEELEDVLASLAPTPDEEVNKMVRDELRKIIQGNDHDRSKM